MPAADSIFVDEFEVARLTGRSIITIRKWRERGAGPPRLPPGTVGRNKNSVRYRRDVVEAWAKANLNLGRGKKHKAA